MTRKVPFGHAMQTAHFQFASTYTPLNHGSFGAYPRLVQNRQNELTKLAAERPDTFIVFDLPDYIDESREEIAPLLGVPVGEVVFVPNATTGINTVMRNLIFEEKDVIVVFSTIYDACEKTIRSIQEKEPLKVVTIPLEYPIEDAEIVSKFRETVEKVRGEGLNIKISMFDTVLTFPGVRMPWEDLVAACKELGILSLIDGAHGIGHIDLTHVGSVGPDFFVSNCHKWLYTPRGCAVFHVPTKNQHLIRTSFPTSHGYTQKSSSAPTPDGKTAFVHQFEFVATIDYTPYVCVPAALSFRNKICGGEEAIRNYCWEIARDGGDLVAVILGTEVMDNKGGSLRKCCFANIRLPLDFSSSSSSSSVSTGTVNDQREISQRSKERRKKKNFRIDDAPKIQKWLNSTAFKEFDTYLQIAFMGGAMWVRLSGQIYLEIGDFEWVGWRLRELCQRLEDGEVVGVGV